MTVKGGFVGVELSPLYQACEVGYPPKMYVTISVTANFQEDMPEVIEIIHKRIIEAGCKINLDINPEGLWE